MPEDDRAADQFERSDRVDDQPESGRGSKIARLGLAASGIAVVVVVVIVVLTEVGVGLGEAPVLADDLGQRAIDAFENHEEWYLLYGRWEDLAVAMAFAGLLLAVPFVNGAERFRHVLVAGSAVAVVGEVIDLSQLIGIEVARFALDQGHTADFVAGNMYRIGINHTAAFVWVAGLLILGAGMLLTAREAQSRSRWQTISALFGLSLIVTGVADLLSNTQVFEIAEYATAGLALAWLVAAYKRVARPYQLSA